MKIKKASELFFREITGQRFGEINMKIITPEMIFKAMNKYAIQAVTEVVNQYRINCESAMNDDNFKGINAISKEVIKNLNQ